MWNYCLQKSATETLCTYNSSLWGGQVGHEDRRVFTAVGQLILPNPWMSKRRDLGLKFKVENNCVRYQCWLLFFTYVCTHTTVPMHSPLWTREYNPLASQHHGYSRIMSTTFSVSMLPLHFHSLSGNFQVPESKLFMCFHNEFLVFNRESHYMLICAYFKILATKWSSQHIFSVNGLFFRDFEIFKLFLEK